MLEMKILFGTSKADVDGQASTYYEQKGLRLEDISRTQYEPIQAPDGRLGMKLTIWHRQSRRQSTSGWT